MAGKVKLWYGYGALDQSWVTVANFRATHERAPFQNGVVRHGRRAQFGCAGYSSILGSETGKPEPCLTRDLLESYGDDNLCGHDPEQL